MVEKRATTREGYGGRRNLLGRFRFQLEQDSERGLSQSRLRACRNFAADRLGIIVSTGVAF